MSRHFVLPIIAAVLTGCAELVYVPPGTSIEVALARKPQVMRMPTTPAPAPARTASPRVRDLNLPPVEPTLPTADSVTGVAEAFTRGNVAMQEGKTDAAIAAYQEAVKGDPKFGEAWQKLAMAYEKVGKPEKAREAFRHAKEAGAQ